MKIRSAMLLCVVLCTAGIQAPPVINVTFDDEQVRAGVPRNFRVFGDQVRQSAVANDSSEADNHCASFKVDFEMDTWGALTLHETGDVKLRGTDLSVRVRASVDMKNMDGTIGFKLIDADGSEYRTAEKDLFSPGTTWQTFSQKSRKLVPDDVKGGNPKLDLGHIVKCGIVFYDRGDCNELVTFFLDDLKAQKP